MPDLNQPYTRAALLEWAEEEARKTNRTRDEAGAIGLDYPHDTAKQPLVCVCLADIWYITNDDKHCDLLDHLLDLYRDGIRGFNDMTIDELLDYCEESAENWGVAENAQLRDFLAVYFEFVGEDPK